MGTRSPKKPKTRHHDAMFDEDDDDDDEFSYAQRPSDYMGGGGRCAVKGSGKVSTTGPSKKQLEKRRRKSSHVSDYSSESSSGKNASARSSAKKHSSNGKKSGGKSQKKRGPSEEEGYDDEENGQELLQDARNNKENARKQNFATMEKTNSESGLKRQIQGLEKDKRSLYLQCERVIEQGREWKRKYGDMVEENRQLQRSIQALKAGNSGKRIKVNDHTKNILDLGIKLAWRTTKFLPPNKPNHVQAFLELVLRCSQLDGYAIKANMTEEQKKKISDKITKWCQLYGPEVIKGHNKWRQYCQQQATDLIFAILKKQKTVEDAKNAIYKIEDLERVVKRELDPKKKEDQKMMDWWVDEYLPRTTGTKLWSASVRYNNTLSNAHLPNEPEKKLCAPVSEAFAMAFYKSSYQKWLDQREWQLEHPTEKRLPRREKGGEEPFPGLFITSCSGQSQFGGWTREGRKYFSEMYKANTEARKTELSKQLEKECLERISSDYRAKKRAAGATGNDNGPNDQEQDEEEVDDHVDI